MVNRTKISYDGEELTHHLKQSTGRGVNAFFPDPSPTPAQTPTQTVELPQQGEDTNTHARIGARMSTQAETSEDVRPNASMDANIREPVHTRTRARMAAPTDESDDAGLETADETEDDKIAGIRKMIRAKRHLSSFTFRFRANELEELDLVMDELNQDDEHKVSKNDAVRTALNWLLADYKARKQESILARVLMDT